MTEIKRKNPNCFQDIITHLKELEDVTGKAGWFPSSVYENGKPVAYIASIQEFGAVINHPGGTPYGPHGFVSKADGAGLPVTKPHTIVIPPRPFMRPTIAREKNNWFKLLEDGAKKVLRGKISAKEVLELVALRAAGDIGETIKAIVSPPLAKGTIAARRRQMANKKLVGSLDKPLVASGILFNSVTGIAENKNG